MAATAKPIPESPSSTIPSSPASIPRPPVQPLPRSKGRPRSYSQPHFSPAPQKPQSQPQSPSQPQPPFQPQFQPQPQPQPQSQPQSPPKPKPQSKSHPESQKPQPDGASYYGYLFNEDKSPTDTLDALLRAIGLHIIDHIGDVNDKHLSPRKLAAFYHAVGGDYDSLFLKSPDRTISYIWQALGVQHALQPTPDNDYAPPSIPALTLRGFVRWQSVQILLGPEEHVPYIQHALATWNLRHPYTGSPFPVDLPATAFPAECDPEVDKWHRACALKLREAATPSEDDEKPPPRSEPEPHIHTVPNNKSPPNSGNTTPRQRPEAEYFRRRRPMSYVHVSERHPQPTSHPIIPETSRRVSSSSGSSLDDFPRGRGPSGIKTPPVIVREETRASAHLDPHRPANGRRHSHAYQSPFVASGPNSDSEPEVIRPSLRHNGSVQPPPVSIRRIPIPPPMPVSGSRFPPGPMRPEDHRKISLPAEIRQKLGSLLMSSNRHRSTSREPGPDVRSGVRYHTRPTRSLSGESYTSDGSLPEVSPRYTSRGSRERNRTREHTLERVRDRDREREREREFEREREQRSRERERDRIRELEEEIERKARKDKSYLRPSVSRRTSSHADIDRRREVLRDVRDRRRDTRDLDKEVRRNLTADELDERERRRYQSRGSSPPVTGVTGRRYPR